MAKKLSEHRASDISLPHRNVDRRRQMADQWRLRLSSTFESARKNGQQEWIERLRKIESVNSQALRLNLYHSSHSDRLHGESELPFRISDEPFELPDQLRQDLPEYGRAISGYYRACDKLLTSLSKNHPWKEWLGHSKSNWMRGLSEQSRGSHVFLRPDFILSENGPKMVELETSPFGLALSHFLNDTYQNLGIDTLADEEVLADTFLRRVFGENYEGKTLCFLLTEHTDKYRGQFEYMSNILRFKGVKTIICRPENLKNHPDGIYSARQKLDAVYRGFYLFEAETSPELQGLLQSHEDLFVPPCKPELEEKALMGLACDPEFDGFFRSELGAGFDTLRQLTPKTWVVSQRWHAAPLPNGISSWHELPHLSRKQRDFVLKPSGYHADGSWGRGVRFLGKLSKEKCRETIETALASDNLYVIQEFHQGAKFEHPYFDFGQKTLRNMNGRVRFTPYFDARDGHLLTAKATLCENTDYIHAMVDSINVPVK